MKKKETKPLLLYDHSYYLHQVRIQMWFRWKCLCSQARDVVGVANEWGTPKDLILSLANRRRQGQPQNHFSDIK